MRQREREKRGERESKVTTIDYENRFDFCIKTKTMCKLKLGNSYIKENIFK